MHEWLPESSACKRFRKHQLGNPADQSHGSQAIEQSIATNQTHLLHNNDEKPASCRNADNWISNMMDIQCCAPRRYTWPLLRPFPQACRDTSTAVCIKHAPERGAVCPRLATLVSRRRDVARNIFVWVACVFSQLINFVPVPMAAALRLRVPVSQDHSHWRYNPCALRVRLTAASCKRRVPLRSARQDSDANHCSAQACQARSHLLREYSFNLTPQSSSLNQFA